MTYLIPAKKILYIALLLGLVVGFYALAAPASYGQEPESRPGRTVINLAELNFAQETIRGPYEKGNFRFYLPADWQLTPGAEVQLDFITTFGLAGLRPGEWKDRDSLEVSFNNTPLTEIWLNQEGKRTISLPIPASALVSTSSTGRHTLELTVKSEEPCNSNFQPAVTVLPSSHFVMFHRATTPTVDLRQLPRPIYQGSFLPDEAIIVVPDQPGEGELAAALSVAAGFGKMTADKLSLSLVPAGQLTEEQRAAQHLIFVGQPQSFPQLKEVALPAARLSAGATVNTTLARSGDGLVQMAVSPWNPAKVVLVVGGDSVEAVKKAGLAVSSGAVRVGSQPDLAVVADVVSGHREVTADVYATDRTLADLNYSEVRLEGRGTEWVEYTFEVPVDHVAAVGAYFELLFNNSTLLDYDQSGLEVRLNGVTLGSGGFSEDTTVLSRQRFSIPRSVLRPGLNRLTVRAELTPASTCLNPDLNGLWVTVWPDSTLHLPLTPARGIVPHSFELKNYPDPFILDATLKRTLFMLPADDPAAWETAARLASNLGRQAQMPVAEFAVTTTAVVPEAQRETHHLLVVGRASTLPLIAELGDALPAPFEPGQDLADERATRVLYRLEPGASVGYLQLLAAPWNGSRIILAVLGNDQPGLAAASQILVDPNLRGALNGNFILTNNGQIVAGERGLTFPALGQQVNAGPAPAGPAPADPAPEPALPKEEQAAAADTDQAAAASPSPVVPAPASRSVTDGTFTGTQPEGWILPALGASAVLMVTVTGIGLVSSRRRRR